MNDNPLYQCFLDQELHSKQQVYQFIAETIVPFLTFEEKKQLVASLVAREKIGNNQIADKIVLPHVESSLLEKSVIDLIRPKEEIKKWTEEGQTIQLIIVVLLKKDESFEVKKEISTFIRKLADEPFLEKLLTMKIKTDFYKKTQDYGEGK